MTDVTDSRLLQIRQGLAADWREIGGLGRLAFIGLASSLALTIALGFSITGSFRAHLLEAEAKLLVAEVEVLPLLEEYVPGTPAFEVYDDLVRQELLGGETERLKLWAPDGTVIYSDRELFIGQVFELSPHAVEAFAGETSINTSSLTDAAHFPDAQLGHLIEFYIPVRSEDGEVVAVFEIERSTDSIETAVSGAARNVWASIGVGVTVLGGFMAALAVARARDLNRRRRVAEQLLGRLFTAQEEERRRVVGALHDDIGQPLYRILYGLEGSIARIGEDSEVGRELQELQNLVRGVDKTLRSELATLSEHLPVDAGLGPALGELAELTRNEAGLDVRLSVSDDELLTDVQRVAFYRVAQEGVVNARKHAEASRLSILASRRGSSYELVVVDDGSGSDGAPGLGLTTSRERMEALGGMLEFKSSPRGSTLRARAPIEGGRR